ncbi:MAG: DUF1735 domain-containing protein [Mediterranea sp.]|jgi:hypothetical protein|nr:DUF1735 domain-containing protein [Mediterranea sp.]
MKRKKYIAILPLAALLLTQTACEDNREQYLDDINTTMYIRLSGEQSTTVYKTGETADYPIVVNKAGWKRDATAQADISLMDAASLTIYNAEQGTDYKMLPAGTFAFEGQHLDFSADDQYKNLSLTLDPVKIDELPKGQEGTWVVPIQLTNGTDSVNTLKNKLFVIPNVVIPNIGFATSGYNMKTMSNANGSPTTAEFKYSVTLSIANKWTFNVEATIDPTLLDEYNKANDVDYSLLPEGSYTINKTVAFTPETVTPDLKVTVDRTKLQFGNYVLPIRLASTDHKYFLINQDMSTNLAGISYVPDEKTLVPATLDPGKATYYPDKLNEGSVANLFDDNEGSIFHSQYVPSVPLPHWLTFELPRTTTALRFKYQTRKEKAGATTSPGAPVTVNLYGSMDGVTFKKFMVLDGLPVAQNSWYTSEVMVCQPMKYFRFEVTKAGESGASNYFNLAEFKLWTNE